MASQRMRFQSSEADRFRLICAAPVPFLANGDLDIRGLDVMFKSLRTDGVRYVLAAGTTGEFIALSDAERMSVISAAVQVFGPHAVYAHVGAATVRDAARLARQAAEVGVRRFAAITPYFVPAGPDSVYRYYCQLAEVLAGRELYAYVFQSRATTDVSPESLGKLAEIPGLVGAKLSGLDDSALAPYIAAVPSTFKVFSGNDRDLIQLAAMGATGLVSGVCSVFPRLFVNAVANINAGITPDHCPHSINRAVEAVAGGDLQLLKCGLALRGLPAGPVRVSVDYPGPESRERLVSALREIGSANFGNG